MINREKSSPGAVEHAKEKLRNILGDPIALHIEVVDQIPLDPSGKLRAVISKV